MHFYARALKKCQQGAGGEGSQGKAEQAGGTGPGAPDGGNAAGKQAGGTGRSSGGIAAPGGGD
jgi:hypothetical protein